MSCPYNKSSSILDGLTDNGGSFGIGLAFDVINLLLILLVFSFCIYMLYRTSTLDEQLTSMQTKLQKIVREVNMVNASNFSFDRQQQEDIDRLAR